MACACAAAGDVTHKRHMRSRFVLLTLIWGASFLFIKIGVEALAPLQVAFGRMMFGSLALVAVATARRERLPREWRIWAHLAVAAALANSLPFTLFAYAERSVSSALASIGNATVPLFTLLFALLLVAERAADAAPHRRARRRIRRRARRARRVARRHRRARTSAACCSSSSLRRRTG